MIQHLSHPVGESVNDFNDPSLCSVSYSLFDHTVEMISHFGPGAWLGKIDIKSAFCLLEIRPLDFQLLGFCLFDSFMWTKYEFRFQVSLADFLRIFRRFSNGLLKRCQVWQLLITNLMISCLLVVTTQVIMYF